MANKTNGQPFITLELDEQDATWLASALKQHEHLNEIAMKEIASMSGSDPRSSARSTLLMACATELSASDTMLDRMLEQQPGIKPDEGNPFSVFIRDICQMMNTSDQIANS